ncbi:MAG: flavodoxin family protein, partial [Alistipes sp.]|nr:flavodoxin family protein [Alistipes sp.]
ITVVPFCTHGGGRVQNCCSDFTSATPSSEHKEGLLLNGSAAASCKDRVEKWLQKIGISGK